MSSVRGTARLVSAIAHIRVKSDNGPLVWSGHSKCDPGVAHSYTVEVLGAVWPDSGNDDGTAVQQILLPRGARGLRPGGEYLALLWPEWHAEERLIFPIEDGRVSSSAGDGLGGMTVEEALFTAGEWARERKQ